MEKTYYLSPIGLIEVKGSEKGISHITFATEVNNIIENPPCLRECVSQLHDYFSGKRKKFNLALDIEGSDFQKKVWNQLLKVQYGKTQTYHDMAKGIENIKAVRAVGHALGCNPISIVIPCHRIIGSNGKLVGFAGGLWRKSWLLQHENKDIQGELF